MKNSTERMIGPGSGDINKSELIKEANILLNRAEEILKDLVDRIKGRNGNICPSMQGGSSCGLTSGEV